jgi:hypothetical protein
LLVAATGTALFIAGYVSLHDATTTDRSGAAEVQPIVASDQTIDQGETGTDREGGDDTPLGGAAAERAKAAAQAAVPDATVQEVERDTEGASGSAYEVELIQPDGSTTIKVRLDRSYKVVETAREGRDD